MSEDYSQYSTPDLWRMMDPEPFTGRSQSFAVFDQNTTLPGRHGERTVNGASAMLRYAAIQRDTMQYALTRLGSHSLRILVVAGSNGQEATTLSILAEKIAPSLDVRIDSLDKSPLFTAFAQRHTYNEKLLSPIGWANTQEYFEPSPDVEDWFTPKEEIRRRINILDANAIEDFEAEEPYDLVFCLGMYPYLHHSQVRFSFEALTRASRKLIVADGLKADLNAPETVQSYLRSIAANAGFRVFNSRLEPALPEMVIPNFANIGAGPKSGFYYPSDGQVWNGFVLGR